MTEPSRRRALREDRLRNHERLLDAAISLFDAEGPSAPLHRVAALAEVSEASLYRHFAGRDELVYTVFDRHVTRLENIALETLKNTDAQPSSCQLYSLCEALVANMVQHPSYAAIAIWAERTSPPRPVGTEFRDAVCALTSRAQAEGSLAKDVTPADLIGLTLMVASTAQLQPLMGGGSWQRLLEIGLRGLTPAAASQLHEPECSRE